MKENVIISLADSNYYDLLDELVDSVKRFKESENIAICILDAGLKDDQKQKLSKKVDDIKLADWDIDCLLYTSPSPRDRYGSRMPSSA